MAVDLSKKATLAKLPPRREPYWQRVSGTPGLFVGYRVRLSGGGSWIARRYTEEKRQTYRSLGEQADFDAAVKAAREWAQASDQGVIEHDTTVEDACRAYVERQRLNKSKAAAKDAEGRFNRLVYGRPFGRTALARVRTAQVRKWLNDQVADDDDDEIVRRSKDSANRNLAALKAALNLALRDRLVATDAGWKTVTRFKSVGQRRQHFLTLKQRRALLEACPDDLARFVKALLLTPARPGEMATLTVRDFDRTSGLVTLRGKTGERTVTLSSAAVEFFAEAAKGKIGNAPLFARADGQAWNKDAWKGPFKAAAKAAGLAPDVVLYSLRHTAISELIAGGMDSFLVARLAGTSTAMIDKHYGHLRHDVMRAQLDTVELV